MNELILFIGGYVNKKTKIRQDVYLIISVLSIPHEILKSKINLIRFENISSPM